MVIRRLDQLAIAGEVIEQVRIHPAARKNADAPSEPRGNAAGIFERMPCAFQKKALLRIG